MKTNLGFVQLNVEGKQNKGSNKRNEKTTRISLS
jgi:hypothetical protein